MLWLQCLILLGFGFSWGLSSVVPEPNPNNEKITKTELLWPDECKTGPSYWCQNARSAKDCGALSHCIQTVWMTQVSSSVDNSSACKTCVDFLSGFQNATSNNITIKQLEIVLDAACQILQEYVLVKECMFAVNELGPELQAVIKKMNPHSFCSAMFLCSAASTSNDYFKARNIKVSFSENDSKKDVQLAEESSTALAPASAEPPNKKFECSNCYTLFTTGQKLLKKASRDDVLNGMLEMCGEMSSFSDFCSANVITYFPNIYHYLETVTVADTCHLAGACDELYHFHETTTDLQAAIDNAPEEATDEVCEFCLAMVNHLRDIVVSNTTELEFKQVLEGICKQTGNFHDQCLQLVDQYYELVYQFLVNELDAKEICEEVKLCVPKGVSFELKEQAPLWPVVSSSLDLDESLKNETSRPLITKVQLTQSVLGVKPHFVGASECTWGPSYWCTNMTTSKKCSGSLQHCIHEVWEKQELPVDNGDICNICKDMVKQARDQLNSNETQEELREVFEGSCKLIPIKIARKECIKAVDEFVPELVETLSSQMNPQIVCATVGLCNSARMDLLLQQEKLDMAAEKAVGIDEVPPLPIDRMFPKIFLDAPQNQDIEEKGKEVCEICEMLLHYVQQQMTLPKSEEQIKAVIDGVCVKLPHSVATQCSQFIEVYGDAFIALLAQEIDPSVVCPRIGACTSFSGLIDHVKPTCPLCLLALEALENKIANNKTEATIEKALSTLCHDLPRDMVGECERFVKTSTDQIVDSVIADFSPQETCLYLKFCDASVAKTQDASVDVFIPPITMPRIEVDIGNNGDIATNEVEAPHDKNDSLTADNSCVLCEFVVSKLDQELKDKKTAEEIKKTVYTICKHLPSNVRKECSALVKQYADAILEVIAYTMEPEKVCAAVHLCHSHRSTLDNKVSRCLFCESLIGTLQGISSDKHIRQIFDFELYNACEELPKNYHDVCHNLVEQLAPQIETISRTIPPSFICSHLKVCDNYFQHVDILTSDNCKQGPEFWCISTVNAASCGTSAIEYCQQHVWKAQKPMNSILARKMLIAPSN